MPKQPVSHPLFDVLSGRKTMLENMRKMQEELSRNESSAINALYEVLPNDGTRLFIDVHGVIQDLVRRGFHFANFTPSTDGVPDAKTLVAVLAATTKAWNGVIDVSTIATARGGFAVCFQPKTR